MKVIASVSWGNDSIALMQSLHERAEDGFIEALSFVYADTGWASAEWPARVERAEALARSYGYEAHRVLSIGFVPLARLKKMFPKNGIQFCTEQLKITPITAFLESVDPAKEATIAIGIRREESAARAAWPEFISESEKHGGRDAWFPLVTVRQEERDALIRRAGFEPLPHRSKECFPCINSNRADLRQLAKDPKRVDDLEELEASMGLTPKGKPVVLFSPHRFMGAVGIREVVRWAESERGQFEPASDCDSGFCGG